MDLKKAIISAVVLYAVIFLVASALMIAVNDEIIFGLATLLISIALTFLVAKKYYFKGMRMAKPVREGLTLGLVMAVVSFAIEIPVMVYGFAAAQGWNWFMTWHVMLGYISMLVVPVFAAYKPK